MLDKRMLISLAFFMLAWGAFTIENRQAMAIHSARLAAAASDAIPSPPDPSTTGTYEEDESNYVAELATGTMPMDMGGRRMGDTPGKQLPLQTPEKFSGVLEKVDTGCFADGECYVVVSGKHITVLWGWTNETVGSVRSGEGGIGALEQHIGAKIDVYANRLADGSYTLYGSPDYYVELPNR
jgi:hypothetical protein